MSHEHTFGPTLAVIVALDGLGRVVSFVIEHDDRLGVLQPRLAQERVPALYTVQIQSHRLADRQTADSCKTLRVACCSGYEPFEFP